MTPDEELTKLEENIRRLKIEYDAYFAGGTPRPPHDTLYRVDQTIKKFSSDAGRMNFGQRFRFNSLCQKYAVHSELWRRKLREKEEGRSPFFPAHQRQANDSPDLMQVVWADPDRELAKVDRLLSALIEARKSIGERVEGVDPANFLQFVRDKTRQIKESFGCDRVQFSVVVESGKVKFTAVKAE